MPLFTAQTTLEGDDAAFALAEALERLPTGEAASEVARALGLNRKTLYRRALELRGK